MSVKVKLFGRNVMVRQVKKDIGRLHLPDSVKTSANAPLFDLVVSNVGDGVTRLKVGDKVMGHFPESCARYDPETGEVCMLVQEDMVSGVIVDELQMGGSTVTLVDYAEKEGE